MPQLNPAPWLMIMVTAWITLLILFSPKVNSASQQNPPLTHDQVQHKTSPWNWPWA